MEGQEGMVQCRADGSHMDMLDIYISLPTAIPEGEYRLDLCYSSEEEGVHDLRVSSTSFTVSLETPSGLEGGECLRYASVQEGGAAEQCGGCTVFGVTDAGIVESECEPMVGQGGVAVVDTLLAYDVARQKAHAAAGIHPDGVSCRMHPPLKSFTPSLLLSPPLSPPPPPPTPPLSLSTSHPLSLPLSFPLSSSPPPPPSYSLPLIHSLPLAVCPSSRRSLPRSFPHKSPVPQPRCG